MSPSSRPLADADLHAFVDGQLDFERRAIVVQAMESDPELRGRVEQWRRQNEALTSTFGGVLREPVPLRLMPTSFTAAKAPAAEPSPNPASQRTRWVPFSPPRVAAIALASFVAGGAMVFIIDALASGSASPIPPTPSVDVTAPLGARSFASRASEAHRIFATDATSPGDIPAGDEPRLLRWLQHRLAAAIRIPDLRHRGWTLLGGRVLPGELGPAAFLTYGAGTDRIGIYMARTGAHPSDGVMLYENGDRPGAVGYWVDEPVGYALTTSHGPAWLEQEGAQLYGSIRAQVRDTQSAR